MYVHVQMKTLVNNTCNFQIRISKISKAKHLIRQKFYANNKFNNLQSKWLKEGLFLPLTIFCVISIF